MAYFTMECFGIPPMAQLSESPDLPGPPWMTGRPIQFQVSEPLFYVLGLNRPGNMKVMYSRSVPVMRDDLINALVEAGVDNLQLFNAVIRDPSTNKEYRNYKAFNIVGLVSCADMEASKMMGTTDSRMIDADFDSLVIDESKAKDLLIFRLAEAVNAIVVHDKIKTIVEDRRIPGMIFNGPGEWSG